MINKLYHHIFADAAEPWQMYFQDTATPVAQAMIKFHDEVLFHLIFIIMAVLWMILYICYSYYYENRKHVLKYASHGTFIEIFWTITPAVVLVFIAYPSFQLLYWLDEITDPAITIKVVGHQWYWTVEYTDYLTTSPKNKAEPYIFDSYLIPTDDLPEGQLRLLEVDKRIVLPIKTQVRIIVTGADVLHSWAVPSLGVKVDAVPGRLNQTSVLLQRTGVYYGQCSEICGVQHGFMPIVVEGVPMKDFLAYIKANISQTSVDGHFTEIMKKPASEGAEQSLAEMYMKKLLDSNLVAEAQAHLASIAENCSSTSHYVRDPNQYKTGVGPMEQWVIDLMFAAEALEWLKRK